jgi:hypothetical protein
MTALKSPVKRFFDQSYQNKLSQSELHLQLSKQYLQIALYHPADHQYFCFEEYYLGDFDHWNLSAEALEKVLVLFSNSYKKVKVGLIDGICSHCPEALLETEKAAEYLKLNFKQEIKLEEVKVEKVAAIQMAIIYQFPASIYKVLNQHFNSLSFHHYHSPLLEFFSLQKEVGVDTLNLHIQYQHFDILHFKAGKVNFINRFEYSTVEDFAYFLLYVMEQLQLDREKINLKLFGEIDKQSSIYTMLYKYIRNIELKERNKQVNYSQVLSELQEPYFFNLFNQYLCE